MFNTPCCEICEVFRSVLPIISSVAHLLISSERFQLTSDRHLYNSVKNRDNLIRVNTYFSSHCPWKLFYGHGNIILPHIDAVADTTHIPTYTSVHDMTQTTMQLHHSDILYYYGDGSTTDGPNDIDISRMIPGAALTDYDIDGSPYLRRKIQLAMHEYRDIFSYNVKGKAMLVPLIQFSVQLRLRVPSSDGNHIDQSASVSISHILTDSALPKSPILAAVKC